MADVKFNPGDIVIHVLEPNAKIIVLSESTGYIDLYTCRFFNTITGLYVVEEFQAIELSLAHKE
jgi:hypothetical protein